MGVEVGDHTFKKNLLTSVVVLASAASFAGPRDQAKKLYSSLTGNTANKAVADRYEAMIRAGNVKQAANDIVEGDHGFYNVTLKNFYTPMSNEDGTQFAPLNDMTALLIGATRDEINFFRVFYDDIMYQFDGYLIDGSQQNSNQNLDNYVPSRFNGAGNNDTYYLKDFDAIVKMYNRTKNDMYADADRQNLNLSNRNHFVQTKQYGYTINDSSALGAIAGIFSTRAWAQAYYVAGTNRAAFAYFAKNFMCLEMEELNDTTTPDFRVRRDVDRAPGGSAETYKTFCVGCHAGQDALGGAFSYYDYVNGSMFYSNHTDPLDSNNTVGPVAPKINANNVFPDGKITTSDSWINLWNEGQNSYIGWGPQTSGNGVKELGKMLSETKQVRHCLAEKVFEVVCYRKPQAKGDKAVAEKLAANFDKTGNMKQMFIDASIACIGE